MRAIISILTVFIFAFAKAQTTIKLDTIYANDTKNGKADIKCGSDSIEERRQHKPEHDDGNIVQKEDKEEDEEVRIEKGMQLKDKSAQNDDYGHRGSIKCEHEDPRAEIGKSTHAEDR